MPSNVNVVTDSIQRPVIVNWIRLWDETDNISAVYNLYVLCKVDI